MASCRRAGGPHHHSGYAASRTGWSFHGTLPCRPHGCSIAGMSALAAPIDEGARHGRRWACPTAGSCLARDIRGRTLDARCAHRGRRNQQAVGATEFASTGRTAPPSSLRPFARARCGAAQSSPTSAGQAIASRHTRLSESASATPAPLDCRHGLVAPRRRFAYVDRVTRRSGPCGTSADCAAHRLAIRTKSSTESRSARRPASRPSSASAD